MSQEYIVIQGAREHNLKNINLKLPREALIVVTGLSGSGKSSLAFDTIYAEGQRRYMESLSSYARQFLERLQKPNVDFVDGLSPAIAIEQRTAAGNPRSTVGTQTEIYDYLRLLFARIGRPHCSQCGRPVQRQDATQIVDQILSFPPQGLVMILAPLVRGRKGDYRHIPASVQKAGFVRLRADGKVYAVEEKLRLERYKLHTIEVVVDRLRISPDIRDRLTDSVETALKVGKGTVIIYLEEVPEKDRHLMGRAREFIYSELYACAYCGSSLPELEPRVFSFNSPYGACPACNGLGMKMEFDVELVVPDPGKSINEGAIEPWRRGGRGYIMYYKALLREFSGILGFSLDTPFGKLKKGVQKAILYGDPTMVWGKPFEGVIPNLERLFHKTDSEYLKEEISRFISNLPCPQCNGSRLKPESLAVTIKGKTIWDVTRMTVLKAQEFFLGIELIEREKLIAEQALKEIIARLKFCIDVGLDYLTLDRRSATLAGGEAQRIRLATQVGSRLTGVLYILDEPSIGLHQRDNAKLLTTLKSLRDLGNTLVVVEHDESTIRSADYIVDLGPGAGRFGGEVIYGGDLAGLLKQPQSLTARYLRGDLRIPVPQPRRAYKEKTRSWLRLKGAREHNLKNIDIEIPLGLFVCVTGVSGSGKSTLVDEILYRGLYRKLHHNTVLKPGLHDEIMGWEALEKVIVVDQSPIGRTPRSNPATYTNVFGLIRQLFSQLPEAKTHGYRPGRFSFNVKGGRCEACQGEGIKKIEMHFLPDIYMPCEVCAGRRFNQQTLQVRYKGYSIADVLEMPVEEARELFKNISGVRDILQTIYDVGLGYIQLGQSATTLSGGEAQRVKLATQLSRRSKGQTLYILDEPTTGLHFADVEKLLSVLNRLVEKGHTVLVIEHNLEVIKFADYIIDLGPEGGDEGGRVVAEGSPEEIVNNHQSHTGRYLRQVLKAVK